MIVVNPHDLNALWPEVWPILRSALSPMDSEQNLKEDLFYEHRYLLIVGELYAVVQPSVAARRFLDVNYVAGKNISKWQKALNAAINIVAKEENCEFITSCGTRAWSRIWPDFTNTKKYMYIKEVA